MSKTCIQLQDIDSDLGCTDNTGGIVKVAAFYHDDVQTWPTDPTNPTDLAAAGTLEGDLVLKGGKKHPLLSYHRTKVVLPLQNKEKWAVCLINTN